jgi:hypothetical protein
VAAPVTAEGLLSPREYLVAAAFEEEILPVYSMVISMVRISIVGTDRSLHRYRTVVQHPFER